MSTATNRRTLSIRLFRRARHRHKPHWISAVDIFAVLAVIALVVCELSFPLADKDFSGQISQPVVNLALLSAHAQNAMEKFDTAAAEFYKTSWKQTRYIDEVGADVDRLLADELEYLSYYRAAGAVMLDELQRIQLLGDDVVELEKSDGAKHISADLKQILSLQPNLNQCIQSAVTEQRVIDDTLRTGPNEKTRVALMVSEVKTLPDFFRGRKAHWVECRNNLVEFDRRLEAVTSAYPTVLQVLEERSEKEKKVRAAIRWIATFLLVYWGSNYRRRWIEAAAATFGG